MSFRYRRRGARIGWAVVFLAAVLAIRWWSPPRSSDGDAPPEEGLWHVDRVVDGDTLVVSQQSQQSIDGRSQDVPRQGRVRLIGVDTPETVRPDHPVEAWGPQATAFTRQFVAHGSVRLQFDKERVDKYQRMLAYVWVGDRLLNEELVRAGLARAERQFRYSESMKRRFFKAQDEAKTAGRGLWSGRSPAGCSSSTLFRSRSPTMQSLK
jgi:micrococcal nuclease